MKEKLRRIEETKVQIKCTEKKGGSERNTEREIQEDVDEDEDEGRW